ncbi:ABC transporter substrate-binding protein [bacterium]|nr:ABC transporter substrate-binding protein [bacterium]
MHNNLVKITLVVLVLFAVLFSFFLVMKETQRDAINPVPAEVTRQPHIERIVSLAPSLTETVFALNMGHKLVGITRFCNYPPETASIPKVGGYYDPNYEAIVRAKPDLVLLLIEQTEVRQNLEKMKIRCVVLDHQHIAGIIESIPIIGRACGVLEQAQAMVANIQDRLDLIATKVKDLPKPTCLFIVDRDRSLKGIQDVYVSCLGSFYDEIITLAGGTNACLSDTIAYPKVSAEGILQMNPALIIEMVGEDVQLPATDVLESQWASIGQVAAVRNNQVFYFTQDYAVIPGPRFVSVVEDCAKLFHPELEW